MKKYLVRFCYPAYFDTTVEAENEQEAYELAFDDCCNSSMSEWEIGEDYLNYDIEKA